ncbi:hypothetical protein ACFYTG_47775 [Streptomyces mirabilis]|uniref:hypothetical protein n=1 Tax=Streptomyces mirabilis TaxID=68239 RepID=UPI0036A338D3
MRDHLEQAVEVLALEYTSMALNENGSFYPKETLYTRVAEDGNTAALRALEDHLASSEWALYRIRRVFPPARADSCKEQHGDSCRSPWPGCIDPDTGERTPRARSGTDPPAASRSPHAGTPPARGRRAGPSR